MWRVELGGVVPDQLTGKHLVLIISNIDQLPAVLAVVENKPEAIIVFLLSISGWVEAASLDISGHQN